MAKFNLIRVLTEYEMMKSVLDNADVQKLLNGQIPSGGVSPVRDLATLKAMSNYVNELGQMKIVSTSVLGKRYETFDSFVKRLKDTFVQRENAKTSGKLQYSENPFEEGYVTLVSSILSMENAEEKIRGALNFNTEMNDKIAQLPIILGGKKQSSYVKLLAEYNTIYANISELQNEIAVLKEEGKGKDARIAQLQGDLEKQIKLAEAYRTRVTRELLPTNNMTEEGMKEIMTLLSQSLTNLSSKINEEVSVENKATRKHVTNEADRVVNEVEENSYRQADIEIQIRTHSTLYPSAIKILTNTDYIDGKNLGALENEILRAAGSVGISQEHKAVVAYTNYLKTLNDSHRPSKISAGKVITGVLGGALAAAALIGAGYGLNNLIPVSNASQMTLDDFDSYIANENQQKEDFENQLNEALENGTFYNEDGIPNFDEISTEGVDLKNPEVKNYVYFEALAQEYEKDDDVVQYKTSSSDTIRALLNGAQKTTMANYYETNYANLLSVVSQLNTKIDSLTAQLKEANAKVDKLQAEVDALQAEVDRLQALLDAAEQRNSELQSIIDELQEKLDAANEKIEELENENQQLKDENATLRTQVGDLTNQISDLLEEINRLRLENSVLLAQVAELNAQVVRSEKLIAQLQEQLSQVEDGEYTALMEQIAGLQAELAEAKAQLNEVITENESLKAQVVQLRQELNDAVSNYNELLEKYNELRNSDAGAYQEELAALRAELAAAYNKIASYESKIVAIWNGLSGESTSNEDAMSDLEKLLSLYGIDYNDKGASSYSSSNEYEPQP